MANEEHLKILLQGVEVWNQWRKDNPEIVPDIRGANLQEVFLIKAYFNRANLQEANLYGANLYGASFCWANLFKVNLYGANLQEANLYGANLKEANLYGANLEEANLDETKLFNASLSCTNLRGASLHNANLIEAFLVKADIQKASLWGANLQGAYLDEAFLSEASLNGANLQEAELLLVNLQEAELQDANLLEADLTGANLTKADLTGANLTGAHLAVSCLIDANLDTTNLTGACLWETQRAGWSIKGVTCEYIYWDKDEKEKVKYAPGEFERLFAEQTKIRLFYKNGIDPLEIATLPTLIQHLEELKGCALRFVSINIGAGDAVVELALENTKNKTSEDIEVIKQAVQSEAERNIQILREILESKEGKIKKLKGKVEGLKETISDLWKEEKGDTYNISGQAGAVGPNAHAHDNTFNQLVNQFNQSIDLSALAKELSELRQAIKDKQDSSPQADIALVKVAEAEIAAGEKDTAKVIEHLKAAGKWTMDFAGEIGKDVVVAVIKQAMMD
jgi:uncharacterized protein YjbI with pentapeptide repeats